MERPDRAQTIISRWSIDKREKQGHKLCLAVDVKFREYAAKLGSCRLICNARHLRCILQGCPVCQTYRQTCFRIRKVEMIADDLMRGTASCFPSADHEQRARWSRGQIPKQTHSIAGQSMQIEAKFYLSRAHEYGIDECRWLESVQSFRKELVEATSSRFVMKFQSVVGADPQIASVFHQGLGLRVRIDYASSC